MTGANLRAIHPMLQDLSKFQPIINIGTEAQRAALGF